MANTCEVFSGLRRVGIVALLATVFAVVGFRNVEARADEEGLAKVIAAVEQNEQLYRDLDVTLWSFYRDNRNVDINIADPGQMFLSTPVTYRKDSVHFVSQDNLFRIEGRHYSKSDLHSTEMSTLRLYDGREMATAVTNEANHTSGTDIDRLSRKSAEEKGDVHISGNSAREPWLLTDQDAVRPHMLMMRAMNWPFPLSAYLRGDEGVGKYKDAIEKYLSLKPICQEEVDYQNHRCRKVAVDLVNKNSGRAYERSVLWLAEDRNYLPIHKEVVTHWASKDSLTVEGDVTEWKELKPGVWFPMATKVVKYEDVNIQTGQKTVGWIETYNVLNVSLSPHYPAEFFQNPDAAGKVTK